MASMKWYSGSTRWHSPLQKINLLSFSARRLSPWHGRQYSGSWARFSQRRRLCEPNLFRPRTLPQLSQGTTASETFHWS
eukprot:4874295-Heterocapsa_arctica.AAC.1